MLAQAMSSTIADGGEQHEQRGLTSPTRFRARGSANTNALALLRVRIASGLPLALPPEIVAQPGDLAGRVARGSVRGGAGPSVEKHQQLRLCGSMPRGTHSSV